MQRYHDKVTIRLQECDNLENSVTLPGSGLVSITQNEAWPDRRWMDPAIRSQRNLVTSSVVKTNWMAYSVPAVPAERERE
jgi:hypothetical protein